VRRRTGDTMDFLHKIDLTAQVGVFFGCTDLCDLQLLRRRSPKMRMIAVGGVTDGNVQGNDAVDVRLPYERDLRSTLVELDKSLRGRKVDLVVIDRALELSVDPLAFLVQLRERMLEGAPAVIKVRNGAHWSILKGLFAGDHSFFSEHFLTSGLLRTFTRSSAKELFEEAGFSIESTTSMFGDGEIAEKTKKEVGSFADLALNLGLDRSLVAKEVSALDWVFNLRAGQARAVRSVIAVGSRKDPLLLSTVRLAQPVDALGGIRPILAHVGLGQLRLPRRDAPRGIVMTYRVHREVDEGYWSYLDRLACEGWLILHDTDRHPYHGGGAAKFDIQALRNCHAVTVPNEALAERIRPINPHVYVVPSQILEMPEQAVSLSQEMPTRPLRAIYVALEGETGWEEHCTVLERVLLEKKLPLELTVMNAPRVARRLGARVRSLPLVDYSTYRAELRKADVALCPMLADELNCCVSDHQVVESMAHGAVSIVPTGILGLADVPKRLLVQASQPNDWVRAIEDLADNRPALEARKQAGVEWVAAARTWSVNIGSLDALHNRLFGELKSLEADRQRRVPLFLTQSDLVLSSTIKFSGD